MKIIAALLCSVMFIACSGGMQKEADNTPDKQLSVRIAPGHVRIKGNVISFTNENTALVRVDSILGYGSAFNPITKKDTLQIKFLTGDTAEIREPGSLFIGDISEINSTLYKIYTFIKL